MQRITEIFDTMAEQSFSIKLNALSNKGNLGEFTFQCYRFESSPDAIEKLYEEGELFYSVNEAGPLQKEDFAEKCKPIARILR